MDYNSGTETVYKALVNLHDKLEETILQKSQMILKEILNAEKLALLTKIEHLLENEWEVLRRLAKTDVTTQNQNHQTFRCQSCNKSFPKMTVSSVSQNKSDLTYGNEYFDPETETSHLYGSGDSPDVDQSGHDPFCVDNDDCGRLVTPEMTVACTSSVSNYRPDSSVRKRTASVPTVSITPIPINNNDDDEIQVIDVEAEHTTDETADPFVIQYFPMEIGESESLQPPQITQVTNVGVTTITSSSINPRTKRQLQQQQPRQQPTRRNDFKATPKPPGRQYGQGQQQSHQIDISAFKKYQCQYCSYTTDMKSHFIVHIRVHTGEKPYHCVICSKSFTQSSSLNLHLKKIHNNS